jgi:hypothetical protein
VWCNRTGGAGANLGRCAQRRRFAPPANPRNYRSQARTTGKVPDPLQACRHRFAQIGFFPLWFPCVIPPRVAPLCGGGRGLKPCCERHLRAGRCVAPLCGGGRGLKRWLQGVGGPYRAGRSPLRRGAWIETRRAWIVSRSATGRSPLRRGAWIETYVHTPILVTGPVGRSPLRRGAWIETYTSTSPSLTLTWSLPSAEGGVD